VRCGPGALTYVAEVGREAGEPCARDVKETHHLRPLRATGQAGKIVVTKIIFNSKCLFYKMIKKENEIFLNHKEFRWDRLHSHM
jgi:hypothetical protein